MNSFHTLGPGSRYNRVAHFFIGNSLISNWFTNKYLIFSKLDPVRKENLPLLKRDLRIPVAYGLGLFIFRIKLFLENTHFKQHMVCCGNGTVINGGLAKF